ncbi:hypothetical protein D6C77_07504 [Aureobasidium pullulans]|nr:hypothetical protein D6C77_07504 [Aureobasidium pullulans]
MPHSYDDGGFLPVIDGLNINNLQDLERALLIITAEIEAHEEAGARPDLAPPLRHITRVLRLRRQLLSDLDRLLDNWNVYMDLRDVEMHVEVFWGDVAVQDAAEERYRHESHANRIRGLYIQAKRDWSEMLGEFVRMTWEHLDDIGTVDFNPERSTHQETVLGPSTLDASVQLLRTFCGDLLHLWRFAFLLIWRFM